MKKLNKKQIETINENRIDVLTFFSNRAGKKIIIAGYQRPYRWDNIECEILWDNMTPNIQNRLPSNNEKYQLGTIVISTDEYGIEILDGQQRITSILLLLRAIYSKMETMPSSKKLNDIKKNVASCIWGPENVVLKIVDNKKSHIDLHANRETNNKIFYSILEKGQTLENDTSLYAQNYRFFCNACDNYLINYPNHWYDLIHTILYKCVLFTVDYNTLY